MSKPRLEHPYLLSQKRDHFFATKDSRLLRSSWSRMPYALVWKPASWLPPITQSDGRLAQVPRAPSCSGLTLRTKLPLRRCIAGTNDWWSPPLGNTCRARPRSIGRAVYAALLSNTCPVESTWRIGILSAPWTSIAMRPLASQTAQRTWSHRWSDKSRLPRAPNATSRHHQCLDLAAHAAITTATRCTAWLPVWWVGMWCHMSMHGLLVPRQPIGVSLLPRTQPAPGLGLGHIVWLHGTKRPSKRGRTHRYQGDAQLRPRREPLTGYQMGGEGKSKPGLDWF
jgi:hypothetical protein